MERYTNRQGAEDAVLFIAAKSYESGKFSLGQAAEMAGLSKRVFAELLGDYGVSILNYSLEDLNDELSRNAE
jgi:predicted HTH domain antitoxin